MKRIHPLLSLLLLIFAFASCKKSNSDIKPGIGRALALDAVGLQKAAADNAFTFNLFRTVTPANNTGNLFISPLSVGFALGMTSNGAKGATLDSMDKALNYTGFTQAQVNSYYDQLLTNLPQLEPNTTLKIANSIWYRQGFTVLPDFLQTNSNYYKAKVQALNFSDPSSTSTINNWVSDQTGGKIPDIISGIDPGDVMFLINAIYFKSIWATKFDPANTHKMAFNLSDNSQVQADFMQGYNISCKFYGDDSVRMIELPYINQRFSMIMVMPANGKSVNDLIPTLDAAKWQSWAGKLTATGVDVQMPKFKFGYNVTLNDALSKLGMGIAFTPSADFSGINGSVGLSISYVKQKAYVAVDENGTEATAATIVAVRTTASLTPQFTADHPFIFAIREVNTGLILFVGVMNNPLQN